jgi:hypothetical protein
MHKYNSILHTWPAHLEALCTDVASAGIDVQAMCKTQEEAMPVDTPLTICVHELSVTGMYLLSAITM